MNGELMYVSDECALSDLRATDPAAASELTDGMPADPGPMMLGKGSWRYVRWGTSGQPVVAYIVGVAGARGDSVQFKKPNPWAMREGDARAGWTKTLTVHLADVVADRVPSHAEIAEVLRLIGVPEKRVEGVRVEREVGR